MVRFGSDVEAVPIHGLEKDRETIASQVFAGMIAKQKKAALASTINSHFRPHTHGNG
jgi:hypothetical protein